MSKKSVIKSVEPILKNNVHATYDMHGKTFYEYIVEMDNGDKGRAAGTRDTFRFSAGMEVFYEHVSDPTHGDRLKSFAAVEEAKESTTTSPAPERQARYKEDPHKQSLIVAQSCLSSAVEWCAAKENDISTADMLKAAAVFEDWVYKYAERRKP